MPRNGLIADDRRIFWQLLDGTIQVGNRSVFLISGWSRHVCNNLSSFGVDDGNDDDDDDGGGDVGRVSIETKRDVVVVVAAHCCFLWMANRFRIALFRYPTEGWNDRTDPNIAIHVSRKTV